MIKSIEPQEFVVLPVQGTTALPEAALEPKAVNAERSGLEDEEERVLNRTRIEDGQVLIEQYDESGRLLKVTPPGYLPFTEIA